MKDNNISRRKFLQGGVVLGAAVGLSSLTGGKSTVEVVKAVGKKELDHFPYEIVDNYERYDQKRLTFSRDLLGEEEMVSFIGDAPRLRNVIDDSKPGMTTLDISLVYAASSVDDLIAPASAVSNPNTPAYTWEAKPKEKKYEFASKEDASKAIKKAAKFLGASLVGITPYDEKWVYNPMFSTVEKRDVYDTEFPFKPKSVIVLAFEMDYEGMSSAPSNLEYATSKVGYSKMAAVNLMLSTFIRELGYKAFGAGNDTAMSVPYAIAAGLGEQGRHGLLITYEYGPRVRLCKVFTEMDLAYDKPIEFGANKFCQVCKKCATSCPSKSISTEDEMTWEGVGYKTISNQSGVKKYYLNVDSCYKYWHTGGNDCGSCIASCPYNKPDFWHHRITTALTGTPLKPFLNEMDDLFGYGNVFDERAATNFWGLETYTK